MKVLAIDDNEDIRYTLKEICEYAGWEVILAENGEKGVECFQKHKPDVVIVDYHMPRLDGLGTVKKIRSIDSQAAIIVLTVDERQDVANKLLTAGANDFALKPIKAPDLIARVKVNQQVAMLQQTQNQEEQELLLSKGISVGTLQLITDYLKGNESGATIREITTEVGLAYQTVHRYLLHLVDEGIVKVESYYGKVGRPKNKYYWKQL